MSQQASFWPEGFAAQFFPAVFAWSEIGPHDAIDPKNIESALERAKGTVVADVIAALVYQIDGYQITLRAQEETIRRLRASGEDA